MVDAINVAAADSDSDDPFGLTSSSNRRNQEKGAIRRKEFAKQMRRPGSASRTNEAFVLIDGQRTENRVVQYQNTPEDEKEQERLAENLRHNREAQKVFVKDRRSTRSACRSATRADRQLHKLATEIQEHEDMRD